MCSKALTRVVNLQAVLPLLVHKWNILTVYDVPRDILYGTLNGHERHQITIGGYLSLLSGYSSKPVSFSIIRSQRKGELSVRARLTGNFYSQCSVVNGIIANYCAQFRQRCAWNTRQEVVCLHDNSQQDCFS